MRFDDIDCWAQLLNESAQAEKNEKAAYELAEDERLKQAIKEYEELKTEQVDPKTLMTDDGCMEECGDEQDPLEEKIDFSKYGVDVDLPVMEAFDDNPLAHALDPLTASTANLAAQNTVQYSVTEALKDLTKAIRGKDGARCTVRKVGNGYALFAENGKFLQGSGWCRTLDEACQVADECGSEIRNLEEFEKADAEECEKCGDPECKAGEKCGLEEKDDEMFEDMLNEAISETDKIKMFDRMLREANEEDEEDVDFVSPFPTDEEEEALFQKLFGKSRDDMFKISRKQTSEMFKQAHEEKYDQLTPEERKTFEYVSRYFGYHPDDDDIFKPVVIPNADPDFDALYQKLCGKSADELNTLSREDFIKHVTAACAEKGAQLTPAEKEAIEGDIAYAQEELAHEATEAEREEWFEKACNLQKQIWELPQPTQGHENAYWEKYNKMLEQFVVAVAHLDEIRKQKLKKMPEKKGYLTRYYVPISNADIDFYNNPNFNPEKHGGKPKDADDGEGEEDDNKNATFAGTNMEMAGAHIDKIMPKKSDIARPYTPIDVAGMHPMAINVHDIDAINPSVIGTPQRQKEQLHDLNVRRIDGYVGSEKDRALLRHVDAKLDADEAVKHMQDANKFRDEKIDTWGNATTEPVGDLVHTQVLDLWKVIKLLDDEDRREFEKELLDTATSDSEKEMIYRLFAGVGEHKDPFAGKEVTGLCTLLQQDLGAMLGIGTAQNGKTGAVTQFQDKYINLMLYALCTIMMVDDHIYKTSEDLIGWAKEHGFVKAEEGTPQYDAQGQKFLKDFKIRLEKIDWSKMSKLLIEDSMRELFRARMRSEDTVSREVRKMARVVLLQGLMEELGINAIVSTNKNQFDQQALGCYIKVWDQEASPADKKAVQDIIGDFHDNTQVRKMKSFLTPEDNTRFQALVGAFRDSPKDENGVPTEVDESDAIELMTLDFMRRGYERDKAEAVAVDTLSKMDNGINGEAFTSYILGLAKKFLRGGSKNANI